VEATQTAHGIIAQFALEHFRRRKPRVSAVALCHFLTYLPDIKWGIIDYYGKRKLAFDYVQRAYQPLLPSLEYAKRRWRAGETLEADIWIVNDHQHAHEGLSLGWRVLDPEGKVIEEGAMPVDVAKDSSAKFHEIRSAVRGTDGEFFHVQMTLTQGDGTIVSQNTHTLTVGDQQAAKQHCLKLHADIMAEKENLGKGYYRYHPELWDLD
jgi:beta-mannosidase